MSASVYLSSAPSHNSQFLACWSELIDSSLSIRLTKELRCFHPVLAVQFNCFVMVEHSSGGCFVILSFKKKVSQMKNLKSVLSTKTTWPKN